VRTYSGFEAIPRKYKNNRTMVEKITGWGGGGVRNGNKKERLGGTGKRKRSRRK
jgi:hypothetical protein